jgi:hypothetical protein
MLDSEHVGLQGIARCAGTLLHNGEVQRGLTGYKSLNSQQEAHLLSYMAAATFSRSSDISTWPARSQDNHTHTRQLTLRACTACCHQHPVHSLCQHGTKCTCWL